MTPVDLPSSSSSIPEFLSGGGVMGERIRSFDWSKHPLGPPEYWPQSLKIAVRIMLTSRYAMWMGWGPELYFFCNDSYVPTLGVKQSWALGASAKKVWAEVWAAAGPRAEFVITTGKATWDESLQLMLERSGFPEETYHTFSYSPLPDDSQKIGGMLCVVTEDTERVIGERRVAMLRELASDLTTVNTEEQLFPVVIHRMQVHARDIPFALIYLFDEEAKEARLAGTQGVSSESSLAPLTIHLGSANNIWPARELFENSQPILIENLGEQFDKIPTGPWDKPARQAIVVPMTQQGQKRPAGFLVAGINPYRPFDESYRGFLSLLAGQVAAGLSNARAYAAERKLSLIYNNASDVIFYLAVEPGERFRFVSVNPSFFAATGLSENQVLGKRVDEVIPEPSLAMVLNHYRQAIREKRTVRWEETSVYPSGKKVGLVSVTPTFDASGTCVNLIGTVHDITQRKQAEAQLRESEERFRAMADATPTLIWVTGSDKRCQYFNKTWLEFVGNTLGEQIRLGWSAGIHPDELQRCLDAYNRAFDARQPFKMEYPLRRHDGEYRWMLNHGVPRFASDGTFLGYIGGCVDIDDQKRSEEKLEHLVAERTTRLRETIHELEAFSYSISHDMRAPLRAMQGYADVLLQEHKEGLDAEALHFLERIHKSALRLDQLTRDVLAYSKVAKGEIAVKPIDLKPFLEAVIPQYPNFQPPGATVSLGPLPGRIMANESYLTQIVSNLIGNAVKFVPSGRVAQVHVWSEAVGDKIKVWVEDNGIGIAPEHHERIFQIFGRINPDKMFEGTGIGLSIVKKAVERMGGEIGIESQVGEGSRFWFTLRGA
jgi:PAS domain S-box-containing protein